MEYFASFRSTKNFFFPKLCFIDTEKHSWTGDAIIPMEYFPPNVDKFNAYSIHGPADERIYKALFPVPGPYADFHRLEHFQDLPCKNLIDLQDLSSFWSNAIKAHNKDE